MVFPAGRTSVRDEVGKNFWRKLLKLLETTILVSEDDFVDDDCDNGKYVANGMTMKTTMCDCLGLGPLPYFVLSSPQIYQKAISL